MKRILRYDGNERTIEIDPTSYDLRALEEGRYLLLHHGRVIRVTRAGERLLINGRPAAITLENPRDRKRTGQNGAGAGRREVKAAMPGKVVKVLAAPGQTVEAGQGLLILEAMKMQNEVKSPGPGTVLLVHVTEGDTVASGKVLVTLE